VGVAAGYLSGVGGLFHASPHKHILYLYAVSGDCIYKSVLGCHVDFNFASNGCLWI
jgi:hypothetical protein